MLEDGLERLHAESKKVFHYDGGPAQNIPWRQTALTNDFLELGLIGFALFDRITVKLVGLGVSNTAILLCGIPQGCFLLEGREAGMGLQPTAKGLSFRLN